MQKDVIYIDTEDDITAIIGKVKASDSHIVALVPPKRIGVIQSAVNLKLVHRAAEQADKRLVVISNNQALATLAGSAGIPVAKNLQSKPELAEISALEVDGDDIIDGSELMDARRPSNDKSTDAAVDAVEAEDKNRQDADAARRSSTPVSDSEPANKAKKSGRGTKIPDFNTFRKKFFIVLAIVIALVGFFVWAIVIAPHATITIIAKTSGSTLNTQVSLANGATTSLKAGTIKSESKTLQKTVSTPFTATGKKDVGTKATGTVRIAPTRDTIVSIIDDDATVPAGTTIASASGATYVTNQTLSFTYSNLPSTRSGQTVGVTATENGTKYNGASGSADGPSGFTTSFTSTTTGGTDKTITIVQQSDVDSVSSSLMSSDETAAAKAKLISQLGSDYVVLDGSFKSDSGSVTALPAVGQEDSDGKGTLSGVVTFSIVGVKKTEITTFLDAYYAQQIDGTSDQKVYDNGARSASFTNVAATSGGYNASITATGKIGPKIDDKSLKDFAKGKKTGEIMPYIQKIDGVEDVDVKLSPFWVKKAPSNIDKITIKFDVNGK